VGRQLAAAVTAILAVAGALASCANPDQPEPPAAASPSTTTLRSTTTTSTTTTTPPAPTTSTTEVRRVRWPPVPVGPPRAVVTASGVVLAVVRDDGDGRFLARSPCGAEVMVTGTAIPGATVVLDPGHGGDEAGAIGPAGTAEKDVNLAVAQEAKAQLEALGATVVLTRNGDHRITLASRAAIAIALRPEVFVSVHHNAEPDGPSEEPGAETYFQVADPASRRAAGLLYEELHRVLRDHDIAWVADRDAGAKYRRRSDGTDYYGILQRTAGVPAVLSEAAFISNPPEEALLASPAFQSAEAGAITEAVVRFVTTDDPGSGFVEPYPRSQPAGPGGGPGGCVDPPLG